MIGTLDLHTIIKTLGLESEGRYLGNKFIMKCPFHNDNNPSFNIYPFDNEFFYKCFSCGKKGHINSLFKKYKGKSYNSYFNINFYEDKKFYQNNSFRKIKKLKLKEMEITGNIFPVTSNLYLLNYLKDRNIFESFIEYFNIEYMSKGYITYPVYNRFIIPIKDLNDKIISYEIRAYYKASKKLLYPKNSKHKSILFNISNLDFNKPVYLTEGILDLCNLFSLGYRNIGCFFNNDPSDEQLEFLNKFKEINICMDNDEGGEQLVSKLYNLLEKEFYIIKPKKYKDDPSDLSLYETKEAIKNKILSVDYFLKKYELTYTDESKNYDW